MARRSPRVSGRARPANVVPSAMTAARLASPEETSRSVVAPSESSLDRVEVPSGAASDERVDMVTRTTRELVRFVRETQSSRAETTDRIVRGLWWACGLVLVGSAIAAWFFR